MPSSYTLKIINVNFIKYLFFNILYKNAIAFSILFYSIFQFRKQNFVPLFFQIPYDGNIFVPS